MSRSFTKLLGEAFEAWEEARKGSSPKRAGSPCLCASWATSRRWQLIHGEDAE
jgi:hypothetical protein